MKNKDLWQRLLDYDFPTSRAPGRLEAYLADKNRLDARQAAAVMLEYRRFLYLAATSKRMVAPPPLLDQVWHLHLEDTRFYVEDFCARVIGRVIHHTPGRESALKDPLYFETMGLYSAAFGVAPHPKVWPDLAQRKRFGRMAAAAVGFGAAGVGLFLLTGQEVFGLTVPVAILGLIWAGHVTRSWRLKRPNDGSGCGSDGGGDGCGGD